MFKRVSFDLKLLLSSVTVTLIGILLPWVNVHEAPLRGFHFKYGIWLLILLIICLMIAHISSHKFASILIIMASFLSLYIVILSYVDLFGSTQSPSFFNLGIGAFITGLGTVGIIISGISGVLNHRDNRS